MKLSKAVIFSSETHTITYNGQKIIIVERKTGDIVACAMSTELNPTEEQAIAKMEELLTPVEA